MKFDKTTDTERPYQYTFENHEPDIIRAVYREDIVLAVQKGNVGSVSNHELWVSSWQNSSENTEENPFVIKDNDPLELAHKLEAFYERTDEALIQIAQPEIFPAFANGQVGVRLKLGRLALELANEIRTAFEKVQSPPVEEVAVPSDMDSALQEFLQPKD